MPRVLRFAQNDKLKNKADPYGMTNKKSNYKDKCREA
jgi:hypothetical protein